MTNLKSKYDLDDVVYYFKITDKPPVYKKCLACDGDGWLPGKDGKKYDCPNCKGTGQLQTNTKRRPSIKTFKKVISQVKILKRRTLGGKLDIAVIYTGRVGGEHREKEVFKTRKEAQKEARKVVDRRMRLLKGEDK